MSDINVGLQLLDKHLDEHTKAETYYDGTQPEVFASRRLRRALEETGTKYRINFARTPVSAVLDRLEIAAITGANKGTSEKLDEIWWQNELHIEAEDFHRWALVYGECYAIVWPDGDGGVDINYNSPKTTKIIYDTENPRKKSFAVKRWVVGEGKSERVRLNLYYSDRIEKYISKDHKPKSERDFEPYIDTYREALPGEVIEEGNRYVEAEGGEIVPDWPILNEYGEVPVFHFRTQRPYGRPEHAEAYGPQDMINKLVINQMASTDFHGFPQRYVLAGLTPSSDITEFDDLDEDGDGATEETSKINSGPGELWWLQGEDLEVGQFDVSDAQAFLEPFKEYVRAMSSVTFTPLHYFDGQNGAPSGESLRASEAPLNKKVGHRQLSFGSTWREIFSFALRILGMPKTRVDVRWESAMSADDESAWAVVKAKIEAGVPVARALEEAGYTTEQAMEFAGSVADPKLRVEIITQLFVARLISQESAIKMARPELTETEVLQEVERIEAVNA